LFRREWRQQLLVLALIVVAVTATILGSAVATNTPPPANSGFGTAQDAATFAGTDHRLAAEIATLEHRFGQVDIVENKTLTVPGSVDTYELRAQNPSGPYGQPMLSLVSGHYPAAPDQVAVTAGIATDFNLTVGKTLNVGGEARRVVGIVENPQDLLAEFALVPPGQVRSPNQVTVLFDAPGVAPQCASNRGGGRPEHRDQERRTDVFDHRQLGHGLRHRDGTVHLGHERRADPKRDRQ
jgi:putative ABC transport system permease protein